MGVSTTHPILSMWILIYSFDTYQVWAACGYIKGCGVSFGESLSYEALFLRMQRQSKSFQFLLSFPYFWWDRFLGEYVDLGINISLFKIRVLSFSSWDANLEIRRESCLCFSFFSESETILVDEINKMVSSRANYDFFRCDFQRLAGSSSIKDLESFPLIARTNWGYFKAFPA